MKNGLLTISDIANMTMFSDRTIRTYIKDGRLKGQKSGGVWTFSVENFEEFLTDDYIRQGLNIKCDARINDFIINRKKSSASLCAVYDRPVRNGAEAALFCEKAVTSVNENIGIFMSYMYDRGIIRLTLIGEPLIVSKLLLTVSQL